MFVLRLLSAVSALLVLSGSGYLDGAQGAKILAVTPLASPSHGIWNKVLLEALADRGHEVTVLTPYPGKNRTGMIYHNVGGHFDDDEIMGFAFLSIKEQIDAMWDFGIEISAQQAHTHGVKEVLINSKDDYDLIVYEACTSESMAGAFSKIKAPIVAINAYADAFWSWDVMGVANYPSVYVQPIFAFGSQMSFMERVQNFLYLYYSKFTRSNYLKLQQELAKHTFGRKAADLIDVERNFDLMLMNSGIPGLDPSRILPANVKEVGCLQCRPGKSSNLPKDMEDWLDDATDGFIFFSLGTNIKSSKLPQEIIAAILNVFSKLKVKVLWKFESEDLPGKPVNVKINKWLSQQDILAHKNIRGFISHGGRLSTQEALYHGVPVFVIPFLVDQHLNGEKMVTTGMALKMNFADFDIATFEKHIESLIQMNSQLWENAKKWSKIARDQPESSLERAVFWTEYVIRHKGAKHLRPPGQHLNWIQLHSLDVVAFLSSFIIVPLIVLIVAIKNLCFTSSKTSINKQKIN